jgi:hypothetical protein
MKALLIHTANEAEAILDKMFGTVGDLQMQKSSSIGNDKNSGKAILREIL